MDDQGEDEEFFTEILQKYAPDPDTISVQFSTKTKEYAQELAVKVKKALQLKRELTAMNLRIRELSFTLLPDLFKEQDLTVIGIGNGVNLELSPHFKAGLTKKMDPELRAQGYEYLRENAPEIVKTNVIVAFEAGDVEAAELTVEHLKSVGLEPMVEEAVHHATLTSWVKERFLEGKEIPLKILNAHVGSYVHFVVEDEEKTSARSKVREHEKQQELDDEVPI